MLAFIMHKKLVSVFLASVTVLTIMGVFIQLSRQDREAYGWVTHTYQVQTRLDATLLAVETGQDAHEDFLLNRNVGALGTYRAAFQQAFADLDALERLAADNPEQTTQLHSLRRDIVTLRDGLDASSRNSTPPAPPYFVREFRLLETVHRSADRMKQVEQDLLEQRTRTNRVSQRRVNIALVCFLIVVSLLLVWLFLAVRQDLMQQRHAERERHAADQKLANILENMSDAFFALDRDWVVTYMNGKAEQVLNRPRSELVGKGLWSLFPDAVDSEVGQQYRFALKDQVAVRFETYDSAHAAWYEVHAHPNEAGLGIFFANIDARRAEAAERERLARQEILHSAALRRNQELQALARRLVEMQEAERGRLAYELHEDIGQVLAGLKLSLMGILKQQEEARENQVRLSQALVTDIMRKVRALSLDLRPGILDDLGLVPALEWYCKHYTEQTKVAVDFTAAGLASRLDGAVETTAYRIVQEALANVANSSGAQAADVRLAVEDDTLTIWIVDHGVGHCLDSADCVGSHVDLSGIQERATLIGGSFAVQSGPALDATMVVKLPLHPLYTSLES